VKTTEGWGFIDSNGRMKIQPAFQDVGDFSGGLARAMRDGYWGLIDKSGEWAIPNRYDAACGFSGKLSNKLWKVELDSGIYFYIGRDGTECYEPEDTAKELSWMAPSRFCFGLEDAAFRGPLDSPLSGHSRLS